MLEIIFVSMFLSITGDVTKNNDGFIKNVTANTKYSSLKGSSYLFLTNAILFSYTRNNLWYIYCDCIYVYYVLILFKDGISWQT